MSRTQVFCSKIKENIEEKTGNNSYVQVKTKMPMFGTGFIIIYFQIYVFFLLTIFRVFFFQFLSSFFFCPFHSDLFNFFQYSFFYLFWFFIFYLFNMDMTVNLYKPYFSFSHFFFSTKQKRFSFIYFFAPNQTYIIREN